MCQYCDKTFSKNFDLQQHIRSHTGKRSKVKVVRSRSYSFFKSRSKVIYKLSYHHDHCCDITYSIQSHFNNTWIGRSKFKIIPRKLAQSSRSYTPKHVGLRSRSHTPICRSELNVIHCYKGRSWAKVMR